MKAVEAIFEKKTEVKGQEIKKINVTITLTGDNQRWLEELMVKILSSSEGDLKEYIRKV